MWRVHLSTGIVLSESLLLRRSRSYTGLSITPPPTHQHSCGPSRVCKRDRSVTMINSEFKITVPQVRQGKVVQFNPLRKSDISIYTNVYINHNNSVAGLWCVSRTPDFMTNRISLSLRPAV